MCWHRYTKWKGYGVVVKQVEGMVEISKVQYLWVDKRGIKAVKKKVCNLVALSYPVATINRLFKYRNKGYEINCAIQEVVSNLVGRTDILNSDSLRVYID